MSDGLSDRLNWGCFVGRYWEMVQRLKINQFYGAPTAVRLLLKYGDAWVKKYDRSSLRTLGSGEYCSAFREGMHVIFQSQGRLLSDFNHENYVAISLNSNNARLH